jgi:hypothetical protein
MFVLIKIYEEIIPIGNGQTFINKTLLYSFYEMFINVMWLKILMMRTEEYIFWGVSIQVYWCFR